MEVLARSSLKKRRFIMTEVSEFINSGKLEAYVLGLCDANEAVEVEQMAAMYVEVQHEINTISKTFERNALANAMAPDPIIKPMLMATIDYMERMKNGEQPSFPPTLHEASEIASYSEWLSRADMVVNDNFNDIQVRVIGYTQQMMTAIVWIKEMAPQEVHNDEHERFLIVEGTCEITIDKDVYSLSAGNFMQIPLHKKHSVKVTSAIPCKAILQRERVAA